MLAPPTDRPPEEGGYRYYVLFLLALTSLLSVADRLVFSILLQDIKAAFTLTDTELGLLGGVAFTVTYVLVGFPAARLADRSVRKTIIAGAILFWSVMTALCGGAVGFTSLFIARTGVGVGEGCSGPPSQSLIADYFRKHELARAMGFLTIGTTMGTVTGLVIGGLLNDAFGWRMTFVAMALPGLALGALLYFTVREPARGRYDPPGARIEQFPLREAIGSLVGNPFYVRFALAYAIQTMIGYAMAFWMAPVMLRQFHVSTSEVAVFLGLAFFVGGVSGPLLGGYLTDWLTPRDERWRSWLPGLVSGLCVLPLWFAITTQAFWPFLVLFGIAYALYVSGQAPILSGIQHAVEPAQRGFAVALAMFFNNLLGQAVGLGLIGWLSDRLTPVAGDYALGQAVFAVCAVAGLAAMAIFVWAARYTAHPSAAEAPA